MNRRTKRFARVVILAAITTLGGTVTASSSVADCSVARDSQSGELLRELLTLNRKFVAAAQNGDTEQLSSLTSADYVAVDPYFPFMLEGPDVLVDEQTAWDDYFRPRNGDEVVLRSEVSPRARRYGNVAILTYVELEAVRTKAQRVRGGRTAKCSFVYALQDRKWVLINSHITAQAWPDRVLIGSARQLEALPSEASVTAARRVPSNPGLHGAPDPDGRILAEVLAQGEKLGAEARNSDVSLWGALISEDYTEFDPYYPFLLELDKGTLMALQRAWDDFDRLPFKFEASKAQRLQIYGDVVVLTTTNVARERAVGGGFMDQAKSTLVYVKVHGKWVLAHSHDGRRAAADGIPID